MKKRNRKVAIWIAIKKHWSESYVANPLDCRSAWMGQAEPQRGGAGEGCGPEDCNAELYGAAEKGDLTSVPPLQLGEYYSGTKTNSPNLEAKAMLLDRKSVA